MENITEVEIKGLKQRDIKKCAVCDNGVMHNQMMSFYKVQISRFIVDLNAVRRQHGLEAYFHQMPALAGIMGPDEDMSLPIGKGIEFIMCEHFAAQNTVSGTIERIDNDK